MITNLSTHEFIFDKSANYDNCKTINKKRNRLN